MFLADSGGEPESLSAGIEQAETPREVDTDLPTTDRATEDSAVLEDEPVEAQREVQEVPEPVTKKEEAGEAGDTFTFVGSLVLPDRSSVTVTSVRAELRGESGDPVLYSGTDTTALTFPGLVRQRYELHVEADGYMHRTESFDWSEAVIQTRSAQNAISERVTLWPSHWIPVVVRTEDGRPFKVIAEELGWEPKNMFVNAFDVRVSAVLAAPGAPPPTLDPELATFRPAPGYQNVELPGGVAGSLELHGALPMWAGLWVHGQHYAAGILQSTEQDLYFVIDLEGFELGMAEVKMRVVDRDSGLPADGVTSTLKADTSAHRRSDLSDVVPADDGVLIFQRVIPGQHELTILRGGNIVQRMLTVKSAERLDLGDVAIGSGPGLEVRVVDVQGQAVPAWVEIGPFEKGGYVEELYPPNLHLQTDDGGIFVAPVPDKPAILRVRPLVLHGFRRGSPSIGSLNYLIDPQALPTELVVVAEDRVDLSVEPSTPWVDGQRVTFEDELGLVVDIAGGEHSGGLNVDLVPGKYTARRWSGEEEIGELPGLLVEVDTKSIRCP